MNSLPFPFSWFQTSRIRVAAGTHSQVRQIHKIAATLNALSNEEFKAHALLIRETVKYSTEPLQSLVNVFALGFEAVRRVRGLTLHPCQISGGIVLAQGGVAEMATGEGKTLTAVLPVILWGMMGRGVHVLTTNDYLAERDADELRLIYEAVGLSVGCITSEMEPEARRQSYARDITYATGKEIGFDFLRDRMKLGPEYRSDAHTRYTDWSRAGNQELTQRELFVAMVDEADSVLIDDARTPLIIGVEAPLSDAKISLFRWCNQHVPAMIPDEDFYLNVQVRQAMLTEGGAQKLLLGDKPIFGHGLTTETLLETMERMLEAHHFFFRNKQYAVIKGEIVLLDESTDRPMEGRKLQRGLHHCLEAKEGLALSVGSKTGAKVTVQSFFRMYHHLAGMTGTAWNSRREFRKTYRLKVHRIPTHLPCLREKYRARVFIDQAAKCQAIVQVVQKMLEQGRVVLIGTPSVRASYDVGLAFQTAGIRHRILNALHEAEEAEIIAQAGQPGQVTIATNMAGRGTDIKLSDEVRSAGGLHVIATELHHSERVDRQLMGRAARQGDPGSYQVMVSLEDELLYARPEHVIERWKRRARHDDNGELPYRWIRKFTRTQRQLERRNTRSRRKMLKSEKKQHEMYESLGLSSFLESLDDG